MIGTQPNRRLQRTALPACRQTGAPPLMLSVKQDIGCSHVALFVFGRPGFAGSFIDDTHDGD
jgi:hypothetical protein